MSRGWQTIRPKGASAYKQKLACMDLIALQDQVLAILKRSDVPLSTGQLVRMLPKVKGYWELHGHDCPSCKCAGNIPYLRKFWHGGCWEETSRVRNFLLKLENEGQVEVFRPGVKGQPFSYRWIGEAS